MSNPEDPILGPNDPATAYHDLLAREAALETLDGRVTTLEGTVPAALADKLAIAANLSDVADPDVARDNLNAQEAGTSVPLSQSQGAAVGDWLPIWRVTPVAAGLADFRFAASGATFNSTDESLLFYGYNIGKVTGGSITQVAGEPSFYVGQESKYNDGTHTWIEWYLDYESANQTVTLFRPIYIQMLRDNVNTSKGATITFDIGTDAVGVFNVNAGATTVFRVDSGQVTYNKPLAVNVTGASSVVKANADTGQQAGFMLQAGAAAKWQWFHVQGDGPMYLYDHVNNRTMATLTAGATTATAVASFAAKLASTHNLIARSGSGATEVVICGDFTAYIGFGGDAEIYRDAAGSLTTSGKFLIGGNVGFYGQAATAKPTGVAVTAAAIHAALVTLNLIAA